MQATTLRATTETSTTSYDYYVGLVMLSLFVLSYLIPLGWNLVVWLKNRKRKL